MKQQIIQSTSINDNQSFDYWRKKNWYYHSFVSKFYRFTVADNSSILHVGCKSGYLLNQLNPIHGVGIDDDEHGITYAKKEYPHLNFIASNLYTVSLNETFDYIILSGTTMEVDDVQLLLDGLRKCCHAKTRIIIDSYSFLWEPLLLLAQTFKLRRPTALKNWLSRQDICGFLNLTDFEIIRQGRDLLIPFYIPFLSWFINSFIAVIPGINRLCLVEWIIARPTAQKQDPQNFSVSIVIPCRNEKGNIEQAIQRCPLMGKRTEIIFAEGNSKDGTLDEIKRLAILYPEKNISYFVQEGKGKGAAVHQAFARASGDILMIQDADLTAPPEELPKFFQALIHGKGDFINGSRLIYGMETQAMRFLNMVANYGFALGFTWLLGQPIKDTLCGTKVLFKKDYQAIMDNKDFFGNFDPYGDFDLLFGAAKLNMKIIDLPVHYKRRTYGTSQISRFAGGWLLLRMSWLAFIKFKVR